MKNKILAVLLSMAMVVSPTATVVAGQSGTGNYESTTSEGTGWFSTGSTGLWDGNWSWGNNNSDSEMWWGDAEVVTDYASDDENGIATCQSEDGTDAAEKPAPGTIVQYNDQISYLVNEDGETCQVGTTSKNISGTIEIPSELDGFTVTGIAAQGFANVGNEVQIVMPDTVLTIGEGAFYNTNVTNIKLSENLTTIEDGAFYVCALTKIDIPASVTEIKMTKEFIMENMATTFGAPMLTEINVDENNDNYYSMDGVLYDKKQNALMVYPVAKSGEYEIPQGIDKIGAFAFMYCGCGMPCEFSLKKLPTTLTEIGEGAFFFSALPSIYISENINSIYAGELNTVPSFLFCPFLTNFEVSDENEIYSSEDGVLFNKDKTILYNYPIKNERETYKMPDSIETIAPGAFYEMNNFNTADGTPLTYALQSVECSARLKKISQSAFVTCSTLKTIKLPVTLQVIEEYATDGSGITDVYYDGTEEDKAKVYINEFGNAQLLSATWHCKTSEPPVTPEKTSWKLEDGVLTLSGTGALESYAKAVKQPWYKDRANITSVVIEDGITEIGNFNFYGLTNLKNVTIADSVTSIGEYAFKNCTSLTEIKLPAQLTNIGESAFYGCTGVENVTIPETVKTIGSYAFARCTGINAITFNGDAPEIQEGAFAGINAAVSYPEENTSWTDEKKQNYGGKLTWNEPLAWEVKDNVLTITDDSCMEAFDSAKDAPWYAKRDEITSVVVKDGVTKIGNYAFYGCNNLTSVELPNSVSTIGSYALKNCGKLAAIVIPENVSKIGESAFYGCNSLTEVTIPANTTEIGDYAFARSAGLKKINFEGSAPNIAEYAFSGVKATVTYPVDDSSWNKDTKKNYGGALNWGDADDKQQCGKDASWKIEGGVLTITGSGAVDNYDSVAQCPWSEESASVNKVVVQDGITSVGDFTFYGMTNLTEVDLADSVDSIGAYAFKNCSSLAEITLPKNLTQIQESAFYGCAKLSSIVIPEKVNKIGNYAFSRCTSLKNIAFKGNAPVIEAFAFNKVTADVTYAGDNTTWTDETKLNYGGTLSWSEEK